MQLRPELLPPSIPAARLAELAAAITAIEDRLERGEDATALIEAFNADTDNDYDEHDFLSYHSSQSLEEFAYEAAWPSFPKVPDITRDELVEIAERIVAVDPDTDFYVHLFETNTVRPAAVSVFHHPPEHLNDASVTELVDFILSYRPIAL
ncbi:hypothetical protein FHR83_006143 [Actinoplanes campanulatus]|uniref:Uncharacterized protein n=1 Tax=Actinoplanes campanulatus TaxID=113559 RepID=A0A7W5AME9_9ACTN|nr:hypothetical protein [Actinoplanes campanulatus]MBB3098444.1 hypothetical protein [Actinoplanes campanulatus]GGN35255.1 hypothetical protein GCM10010109_59120 [Actinoplanes campanulatus]GID39136.1 hypothetical protein Aca09nite_56420 [Actinoplanes campanulatus]